MKKIAFILMFFLSVGAVSAGSVNVVGGHLNSVRAIPGQLDRQINTALRDGSWAAWSVPIVSGMSWGCYDDDGDTCVCSLDAKKRRTYTGMNKHANAAQYLTMFLKAERGEISRLELVSDHCQIDAAGEAVTLINDVDMVESIEFLSTITRGPIMHEALSATALHDHEMADSVLQEFLADGNDMDVRQHAVFWLGHARGRVGYEILIERAFNDPNADFREHITFGLHTSKVPEARSGLFQMAREDESKKVRNQALFWLAQDGGDDVLAMIDEKLQAATGSEADHLVFTLTQIPNEGGISRLIDLVENGRDDDLRGQALFWLGQEQHPAVFKLIDQILNDQPGGELLEKAMLTLSQFEGEDGIVRLLDLAKNHPTGKVRSKALFWLGQKAGEKASEALSEAIENDPDIEVKTHAVFALSQLPKEEAGRKLTELARNHKHPEVRKQALFWLGQIEYEGAASLFEEILLKN